MALMRKKNNYLFLLKGEYEMKVAIEKVRNNPYRDMENYPLDQDHIDMLMDNISKSGLWKNIEGRKANGNGEVELAYGHHRIAAARKLGMTEVDIMTSKMSEDEMIERMITENTTQRGNSTPAILDSVASITRRLAYVLLSNEDYEELQEVKDVRTKVQTCFGNEKSFDTNRGKIIQGLGLGEPLIRRYNISLPEKATKQAISQLKETGKFKEILTQVQQRITEEIEEEERLAKKEEARIKAEEETKAKLLAQQIKEAEEAKIKAKAEAKVQAEIKAKNLAKQAEKQKQLAEEAKTKAKVKVKIKQKKSKKQKEKAKQAVKAAPEAKVDMKALMMFKQTYQADAFKRMVITKHSKEGPQIIPMEQHVKLATLLLNKFKEWNKKDISTISEEFITRFIQPIFRTGKLNQAIVDKEEQKLKWQKNKEKRVKDAVDETIRCVKSIRKQAQTLNELFKENPLIFHGVPNIKYTAKRVGDAIDGLQKLKKNFEDLVKSEYVM